MYGLTASMLQNYSKEDENILTGEDGSAPLQLKEVKQHLNGKSKSEIVNIFEGIDRSTATFQQ